MSAASRLGLFFLILVCVFALSFSLAHFFIPHTWVDNWNHRVTEHSMTHEDK